MSVMWPIPRKRTPAEMKRLRVARRRREFAKWRSAHPGEVIPEWLRKNA